MKQGGRSRVSRCLALAGLTLHLAAALGAAQPIAAGEDFSYHARPGDTLIGLGRRLLIEPQRWRDVQLRNHVVDPRRIPQGSILRIPYAWLRQAAETATVSSITGSAKLSGAALEPGQHLPQGAVVETDADGSVTLDLADGSVVTLQKSSALALDQMTRVTGVDAAHSIRLKLHSGRVETVVKPHRDVGRFEIETPVAVSGVRGTHFRSAFAADSESATTETLEGLVGVASGADSVAIPANFGTRVLHDAPPLPPVALLPPPDLSNLPANNTRSSLSVSFAPIAGAKSYRLLLSRDSQFHAIVADLQSSGPEANLTHLADGRYWLRARAIDALGLEGIDAEMQFLQHELPAAPVLQAPSQDSKVADRSVRLSWDDVAGAGGYALQLARDPTFTADLAECQGSAPHERECEVAAPGRYYWRVAALSHQREQGAWSKVGAFYRLTEAPMPDAPLLQRRMAKFAWDAASGQGYRIQIAHDAEFSHSLIEERVDAPGYVTAKLAPGTYFARLQVIDSDGNLGPFGSSRRFTVPLPWWVKLLIPAVIIVPFAL